MAIFKCKMCGGDLNIEDGITVAICEYCETKQTIPCLDNEKKLNLFNRANRLRMNSEFDKAASIYENIVAEFPEEAEAYWGLCLCNYGIEYVDDPTTAKKIPTCHRASFESLQNDENFELALEYADVVAQKVYRDEAREIDRIMQEILAVSKNEKPYDVFICYKETDEKGERTVDSVLAHDVYDALTAKGLNVFFARITLEDKLGRQYEPYIFAALNSAKVMLAIGTKYEYYNAVWVKNEWSRFLKLMSKDKSKVLIPCFKDIDAYDIPEAFQNLQAQDMSKLGFIQDLVRGVDKLVGKEQQSVTIQTATPSQNSLVSPLIERAFIFLEDSKWKSADEYCEKALDLEPKNPHAYLCKLLAEYKLHSIEDLEILDEELFNNDNFNKLQRYAAEDLSTRIEALIKTIKLTSFEKSAEIKYKKAQSLMKIVNLKNISRALTIFTEISGYSDADECAKQCKEQLELLEKADAIYNLNKKIVDEKSSILYKLISEKNAVLATQAVDISTIIVPADEQIQITENNIKLLHEEYGSLGFFKKKEKQSVQEKINTEEKRLADLKLIAEKDRNDIAAKKIQAIKTENEEKIKNLTIAIEQAQEDLYQFGLELIEKTDYRNACVIFIKIKPYKDSSKKLNLIPADENMNIKALSKKISSQLDISAVVNKNGNVVTACTDNCKEKIDCSKWSDIINVSCGETYDHSCSPSKCTNRFIIGVKSDNTIVCEGSYEYADMVKSANDIETVEAFGAGLRCTRIDGSIFSLYKGKIKELGQSTNFFDDLIKDVKIFFDSETKSIYRAGIKKDGSLVFTKSYKNAEEQYEREYIDRNTIDVPGFDFSDWDSIVDICEGYPCVDAMGSWIVGVKADGTVVATGPNHDCYNGVESWSNIKEVITVDTGTVGITFDGKLIATKNALNDEEKPFLAKAASLDLSNLKDITLCKQPFDDWLNNGHVFLYGLTDEGKIEYCLHRQSICSPDVYPDIDSAGVIFTIGHGFHELIGICSDGSLKYLFGYKKDTSPMYKLIKENPDLRLF